MQSNWWHMIGLTALLWLMMSDTIDRLIPAPTPLLDPTALQAAIPGLMLVDGSPHLQGLIDQQWSAALADPQNPLSELCTMAEKKGGQTAWKQALLLGTPAKNQQLSIAILRLDRLFLLQELLVGFKKIQHPEETKSESLKLALRNQSPDPTYAVSLVLAWSSAAEASMVGGTDLPVVPDGSTIFTTAAARPLAERMVEPLSMSERGKGFSEFICSDMLKKRRVFYVHVFTPNPASIQLIPVQAVPAQAVPAPTTPSTTPGTLL